MVIWRLFDGCFTAVLRLFTAILRLFYGCFTVVDRYLQSLTVIDGYWRLLTVIDGCCRFLTVFPFYWRYYWRVIQGYRQLSTLFYGIDGYLTVIRESHFLRSQSLSPHYYPTGFQIQTQKTTWANPGQDGSYEWTCDCRRPYETAGLACGMIWACALGRGPIAHPM